MRSPPRCRRGCLRLVRSKSSSRRPYRLAHHVPAIRVHLGCGGDGHHREPRAVTVAPGLHLGKPHPRSRPGFFELGGVAPQAEGLRREEREIRGDRGRRTVRPRPAQQGQAPRQEPIGVGVRPHEGLEGDGEAEPWRLREGPIQDAPRAQRTVPALHEPVGSRGEPPSSARRSCREDVASRCLRRKPTRRGRGGGRAVRGQQARLLAGPVPATPALTHSAASEHGLESREVGVLLATPYRRRRSRRSPGRAGRAGWPSRARGRGTRGS